METGLISPAGENLLYFTEFRQVLSTYDGDFRDPVCWPQEGGSREHPHPGEELVPCDCLCHSPHLESGEEGCGEREAARTGPRWQFPVGHRVAGLREGAEGRRVAQPRLRVWVEEAGAQLTGHVIKTHLNFPLPNH